MATSEDKIRKFFSREYGDDDPGIVAPLVGIVSDNKIELEMLLDNYGSFINSNAHFEPSRYSALYSNLERVAKVPDKDATTRTQTLKDKSFLFLRHLSFGLAWNLTNKNLGRMAVTSFKTASFPNNLYYFDLLVEKKKSAERLAKREYCVGKEEESDEIKLRYFWKSLEHQSMVSTLPGYRFPYYYPPASLLGDVFWEVAKVYATGGSKPSFNVLLPCWRIPPTQSITEYSPELTDFRLAFSIVPNIAKYFSRRKSSGGYNGESVTTIDQEEAKKQAGYYFVLSKNFYWCTALGEKPSQAYQRVIECYQELKNLRINSCTEKKIDLARIGFHRSLSPDANSQLVLDSLGKLLGE